MRPTVAQGAVSRAGSLQQSRIGKHQRSALVLPAELRRIFVWLAQTAAGVDESSERMQQRIAWGGRAVVERFGVPGGRNAIGIRAARDARVVYQCVTRHLMRDDRLRHDERRVGKECRSRWS